MESDGIAKSIARWIALGALFLIPFAPLVVANDFFFPFITGKAFFLRILIEIAVAAWVVLASLDKEYRPRFSWLGAAVIAFVAWMFIADLFAVNVAKAFWSNFERMEGWVLLIHLLGFFFAASAVLRAEKKWRGWFLTSIIASLILSVYSLLQLAGTLAIHQGSSRIDATLGNSAYLAIYFLFSVFIALWLASTEKYAWLKWSLIAVAVLESVLIFLTVTRGTVIGLVVALALAAFLTVLTSGERTRRYAAGALLGILIVVGGFYLERNSAFVQNNPVLQRVVSISPADGETRFTIWNMALQGVLERPIFGWGQEGFNYIFNTFYDPSLYHQEPWFDRAHNAFIDWLTAGGVPAFLLYLSLFGTAITLLWRTKGLSRAEQTLLTAALVGYAIHNLFVFDNIYSYIYFFALLAFIDSEVARPIEWLENAPELPPELGLTYALPMATVIAVAVVWYVNIPGMQVASNLIVAISPSSAGLSTNIAAFESLAAHPSFAAQEVREQLVSFATSVLQSSSASTTQKQKVFTLAATEMQKQIDAYPLDAREHLELSYVLRAAGDTAGSLKEIQAASLLSPKKEGIWIEEGATEWDLGNVAAAQKDFHTAYELGPEFPDLAAYGAAGDFAVGSTTTAEKTLLGAYGTTTVDSDILAVAYYRAKAWPRLIAIWKARAAQPSATAQTLFSLAAAYYAAGDKANAIASVNAAVVIDPKAAATAATAIAQIKGQTSGQ